MTNSVSAAAIGGVSGGALLAVEIITGAKIDLGSAISIAVSIGSMSWWLSRRLQSIEDRLMINAKAIETQAKIIESILSKTIDKIGP